MADEVVCDCSTSNQWCVHRFTNRAFKMDLTSLPKKDRELLKANWNRGVDMTKQVVVSLTQKQAELIQGALKTAIDQFGIHLLHEDWDEQLSSEDAKGTLRRYRDLLKAEKLFKEKRKSR